MTSNSMQNHEWDHHETGAPGSEGAAEAAGRSANPCTSLEEEIEVLDEQIALLEESLPQAPGMERAALAKEIAAYRRELEARQRALQQCRATSAAQPHQ
jgi:hypothetical protein